MVRGHKLLIRGWGNPLEDDAVSRNPRLDWQKAGVEGRTGLESLFILESCTGAARGSDPQMTFYECKFLIKLKVGLQIRNEAKFSSFVGAVSFPPP